MSIERKYQGTLEDSDLRKVTFEERPRIITSPDGRTTKQDGTEWFLIAEVPDGDVTVSAETKISVAEVKAALVDTGLRAKIKTALATKLGV